MSLKVSCGGKNGLLVGELTATKFGHLQSLLEKKVCQQLSPIEYPYSAFGGGGGAFGTCTLQNKIV
jgi:hypothetical protein